MKCIYTESEVTNSGAQLLACAIDVDGKPATKSEEKFIKFFPEAYNVVKQIMKNSFDTEPPLLGDVIWSTQGGNKHIGFCIVKKDDKINVDATEVCMKSIAKKSRELGHNYVGMDLFGSDNSTGWNILVSAIEENLSETQAVVCINTNDKLHEVMANLKGGSSFRAFTNG